MCGIPRSVCDLSAHFPSSSSYQSFVYPTYGQDSLLQTIEQGTMKKTRSSVRTVNLSLSSFTEAEVGPAAPWLPFSLGVVQKPRGTPWDADATGPPAPFLGSVVGIPPKKQFFNYYFVYCVLTCQGCLPKRTDREGLARETHLLQKEQKISNLGYVSKDRGEAYPETFRSLRKVM